MDLPLWSTWPGLLQTVQHTGGQNNLGYEPCLAAALHVSDPAPVLSFALGERQGRDAKGFIQNLRATLRGFSEPLQIARKNSVVQVNPFLSQSSLDPGIQPFEMERNSLLKMVKQLPCWELSSSSREESRVWVLLLAAGVRPGRQHFWV